MGIDSRGNGYIGHSMSVNANLAYGRGEKPLSQWRKAELIEEIAIINPAIDVSRLNFITLKHWFLRHTGWHHSGKFYSKTDFYGVDEDYISQLTQNDIDRIENIKSEKPKSTNNRNPEVDQIIDEVYLKAQVIVAAGIYAREKTVLERFVNGKDIETKYQQAIEQFRKNDAQKISAWKRLPEDHPRHRDAQLYETNIEEYIRREYTTRKKLSRNSSIFKMAAKKILQDISL